MDSSATIPITGTPLYFTDRKTKCRLDELLVKFRYLKKLESYNYMALPKKDSVTTLEEQNLSFGVLHRASKFNNLSLAVPTLISTGARTGTSRAATGTKASQSWTRAWR